MITNRNDELNDFEDDFQPDYIEPAETVTTTTSLFGSPLNIAALRKSPPPPRDYVLPSLPRGEVGALVAAGGVGKSMFILQCCHAIASGCHDFIGSFGQGAASYLSFEDSASTIAERLYSINQQMTGLNHSLVDKHLHIYDLSTKPQNIIDNDELIESIISILKSTDSRLCVIDTLSGIHKGDENSNAEMAGLIGAFRRVAQGANCAVVFLHHMSKGAALNNLADIQQASRGASSLTDNVRWQGYMSVMTEEEANAFGVPVDERKMYVRFGISKVNYGLPASDSWYQRNDFGVLYPVTLIKKIAVMAPKQGYKSAKNGGER